MRAKLSAVVVSYNRAPLIGTCLRALGFADEIIVVDKSSTDDTPTIAARHADRVITVPWSPTVEETRAFAVAQCSHDWILCLDDDECLDPEAIRFIQAELEAPRADIYGLLQRHYILGTHDDSAYYWPEHQIRFFRRGAVSFIGTVHGGIELHSDNVLRVAPETGVAIHHLSHQDVAQWIEKTNRYTSRLDRERVADDGRGVARFAHERIDHWLAQTRDRSPGGYPEAVAVLRATYDLIDRLKTWEEERGLDGAAEFPRICARLDTAYAALGLVRDRCGQNVSAPGFMPRQVDEQEVLRRRLRHLRARFDALTAERDANAAQAAAELASLAKHLDEMRHMLEAAQAEAAAESRRAQQAETAHAQAQAEAGLQRQHAEQAAEQAKATGERLRCEALEQQRRAEVESARLQLEYDRRADEAAGRLHELHERHNLLRGSLRTFLRGYLPLLRQHLFGQRP